MDEKKIKLGDLLGGAEDLEKEKVKNYKLTEIKNQFKTPKYKEETIKAKDIVLYKIDEVTFSEEDKYPRRAAFENVISSFYEENTMNLIYIIKSDGTKVSFYIGVVKNLKSKNQELKDTAEKVKNNFIGNFKGSKLTEIDENEKERILKNISDKDNKYSVIKGIPGMIDEREDKDFQGIDRVVNTLLEEKIEFTIAILIKRMSDNYIKDLEANINSLYDEFSKNKKSIQKGSSQTHNTGKSQSLTTGTGISTTKAETKGTAKTTGENESTTIGDTKGTNESISTSKGTTITHSSGTSNGESADTGNSHPKGDGTESSSKNISKGTNKSDSNAINNGTTTTKGDNTSKSESKTSGSNSSSSESYNTSETSGESSNKSETTGSSVGEQVGTSSNISTEEFSKYYQSHIKYIDEKILPIIDCGYGKGLFSVQISAISTTTSNVKYISNVLKAFYSAEKGNKNPLKIDLLENEEQEYVKNLQFITKKSENMIGDKLKKSLSLNLVPIINENEIYDCNTYSPNEISTVTGLPQKEVIGLKLKKEVEFGLNVKEIEDEENKMILGKLVQSGNESELNVCLDKKEFDKHIFIAGVTGSGKTTTCQKILLETGYPFLVIEPAKTEYRGLKNADEFKDLLVFTLGDDTVSPFRMNPFEVKGPNEEYKIKAESIISRIDMIKGAILSSFEVEAAIPQIIEDSLYYCYEKKGWNVATNKNNKYDNPYEPGVDSFPTFTDLVDSIDDVVQGYNFDERLKRDYIGSIKARLKTFTQGSKGLMLSTKRGIDFELLLDKKVVFEIENIKNASEKSFVMALILININEALRRKYIKNIKDNNGINKFRHITLIEEAHRLLSRVEPGTSPNKKEGIEMFSDMLAEVRKYGECLIIADQIPNKLTSEVLKNTNTKIIHKLFAEDDKKSIASTMSFEENQGDFLSSLTVGRAIVFSQGWDKPVQTQISKIDINSDDRISEEVLRKASENFYKTEAIDAIEYLNIFNGNLDKACEFSIDFQEIKSIIKLIIDFPSMPPQITDVILDDSLESKLKKNDYYEIIKKEIKFVDEYNKLISKYNDIEDKVWELIVNDLKLPKQFRNEYKVLFNDIIKIKENYKTIIKSNKAFVFAGDYYFKPAYQITFEKILNKKVSEIDKLIIEKIFNGREK